MSLPRLGVGLIAGIVLALMAGEAMSDTLPTTLPSIDVPAAPAAVPLVTADPADRAWASAAIIDNLSPALGQPAHADDVRTEVRLLWDAAYLYVRFTAQDNEVYTPERGRDAPLYRGDAVEIFIDPEGDGRQYVELQVNALNDLFDQLILLTSEPKSDADRRLLDVVVQRDFWTFPEWTLDGLRTAATPLVNGAWVVDLAIPASALLRRTGHNAFASGMTVRANFVRYDWVLDHQNSKAKRELMAFNWSPVVHGCPHISPLAMGAVRLK